MARGVNKVILIGNLGRDPETRHTHGGDAVVNFPLATAESWKDKSTGDIQEKTEWHNCVLFGRQAEIAQQYLRKGSKVYAEGSLTTEVYEKDGEKRYSTKVKIFTFQMLDGKPADGGQGGGQQTNTRQPAPSRPAAPARQQAPAQQADPFPADDPDDDIPF